MHRIKRERAAAGLLGLMMLTATATSVLPQGAAAAARCSGVRGDVNGDGHAEVAVGEPGNAGRRGAVHLFYGSRRGLVVEAAGSARNDQYLTQDTPGVPGKAEAGDEFGRSTLLVDLNRDGCADLVVGSPGENDDAGWVQVFLGSPGGLRTTGVQSFSVAPSPGSASSPEGQRLGLSLAAGDVDGDGVDDLLASAPRRDVGGHPRAGAVAVVHGSSAGLDLERSVLLTRDTPGVPGAARAYSYFGENVTTGDFDGNGTTELALGSRWDGSSGTVQVLSQHGSGFGGSAPIGPDAAGLPGDAARFCAFGSALASGDVQGDGRDDLVVGVARYGCTTQEDDAGSSGTGAVVLLPGSATGITTAGSQLWTQDSPGVQGKAQLDSDFGSSLALAPLDRDGRDDLAIGAPSDGGGSVTVLLGSATGMTTGGIGGVRYTQSTRGIPGTDEGADSFGTVVRAGFVQSQTQATLVIAAPREAVGRAENAGSVTQIPIGASGPDPSTARTITADTAGVQGRATVNDYFGGWS